MCERAPIESAMLETYRGVALRTCGEDHIVWKLFGYIDWLKEHHEC